MSERTSSEADPGNADTWIKQPPGGEQRQNGPDHTRPMRTCCTTSMLPT
jgi:hypothetical protein